MRRVTEAEAERMADAIVMRRTQTDSAYVNAENAEAQKAAEERIEREVWESLEAKYEID